MYQWAVKLLQSSTLRVSGSKLDLVDILGGLKLKSKKSLELTLWKCMIKRLISNNNFH